MLLRGIGLGMAGMAFGGAFAAGVLFGAGSVATAALARRMMRDRTSWRDHGDTMSAASATGPEPGDDGPPRMDVPPV